nr:10550_t:CDS:2 [Entrophospora candida]
MASPSDVLDLMLKHHKISHQDMSVVFLIVDGLQTTLQDREDSHNKTLETLQDVLVHYKDLDVVNFTDFVSDVQTKATGLIHSSSCGQYNAFSSYRQIQS